MAAMSTALIEFADNGNSRTYSLPGHTVLKPQLVVQTRKVPTGDQTVAEVKVDVLSATTDANGLTLPSKCLFSVTHRMPILGDAADRTAMLAYFRDIIAGDEFGNSVVNQEWLK